MEEKISAAEEAELSKKYLKDMNESYFRAHGTKPLAYLHSFGCQQNVSDGEKLKGQLSLAGYDFTEKPEEARLIILNTCAVREKAEEKVFGWLGDLKHIKEKDPEVIICICGCMTQQKASAEKIKSSYKHVDLVFGTFEYNELYNMLYNVMTEKKRGFYHSETPEDIDAPFVQIRDSKIRAYVPIMYGCNNFCTYCIVPYVRGRERSRKPELIIKEIEQLVAEGYKEIFLLGQNVNSYSYGFTDLLKKVNAIPGDFWIRFMSSHPKDASRELILTILGCEKVCNQLHLPLQSACDRILKAMNRHYDLARYYNIIEEARRLDPYFSFSTDIIVGFPGETYEEFCVTKSFISMVKYDNIYSFVYSKRGGTPAAELPDDITKKEKGAWMQELLLEQRATASEWLKRYVGKRCRVLVESESKKSKKHLAGRNEQGILVEFTGNKKMIGQFIELYIYGATDCSLEGKYLD
ncbi:MAG: tRNA (N6-isopentenyl adenosine(37)-C2)-methylthiotransferase MiaB [Ruminococcus sp.]|nr:tRNA (N6-isopentenyl adenosine(37)-C2)-methylthiotransferase MiaB [Ruminococcus sp.]